MDKAQIIALYNQDQRIAVEYPGMRREVTPEVVRHIDTLGAKDGVVVYSNLNEANADDVIREQVAFFEGIGQSFEWKLYDYDRPADLKDRLEAFGFVIEEGEAIMVLDLAQAPASLWQPPQQDIRRIVEPAKLADVVAIKEQVYPGEDFSGLVEYLGEALRNYPEQMSVYVAYVEGRPVSSGWIYFPRRSQFASLWGGSTVDGFRRRGLYTALLAARAQEAKARRVRYLTVDASPMSRPILEKFGFEMIAYSYPCRWELKPERRGSSA